MTGFVESSSAADALGLGLGERSIATGTTQAALSVHGALHRLKRVFGLSGHHLLR